MAVPVRSHRLPRARLLVARSANADDSAGPAQPATAPPPSTTAGEPTPIAPAPSPSARTPAAYPSARGHDARAISVAHPTPLEDGESGSGVARTIAGEVLPTPDEVFSDSWWGHARPVIEIHGYFRTRAELFQNFSRGEIVGPEHSSTAPSRATILRICSPPRSTTVMASQTATPGRRSTSAETRPCPISLATTSPSREPISACD